MVSRAVPSLFYFILFIYFFKIYCVWAIPGRPGRPVTRAEQAPRISPKTTSGLRTWATSEVGRPRKKSGRPRSPQSSKFVSPVTPATVSGVCARTLQVCAAFVSTHARFVQPLCRCDSTRLRLLLRGQGSTLPARRATQPGWV